MPPCDDCTIAELRRWSLTLAPDGRTLYAANPAVGRVAEVHLPTARVIYEARFPRAPGGTTHSAISPDGSQLLFTNGARLWSYDTHRGYAEALRADAGAVADLAVSRDGARLFVTHPEGKPARSAPAVVAVVARNFRRVVPVALFVGEEDIGHHHVWIAVRSTRRRLLE